MRVLLIIPPMTQLNSPYAATPCLAGFLQRRGIDVTQADASLELALRLFSFQGIRELANEIKSHRASKEATAATSFFLENQEVYEQTVDPVIRFLQGVDSSLAYRLARRGYLPEGPRFEALNQLDAAFEDIGPGVGLRHLFGTLGTQDQARYLASLYIDDLADAVREGADPRFELSRYGEKLAVSACEFDSLHEALEGSPTWVDRCLEDITASLVTRHHPDLVGFTVPFPGNLYGALRMARKIRRLRPACRILLGGGYVNTELRELSEPRVFDYVDYITLDDGERPLLCLVEHLEKRRSMSRLCRTFVRQKDRVVYLNDPGIPDIGATEKGTPSWEGLNLKRYLSLCELPNRMNRLWSEGQWNKLMLAHGCYWKKCAFCDTSLDYIRRYDAACASHLVDQMESIMQQTGQSGFHFTDEASSPALLRTVATELIRRKINITWWGNIRFEKAFTPELVALLAQSGCVAVTGGLETVSDRLLKLMQKGITVCDGARVAHHFAVAGVLVHAYLMYGFPTQTVRDTVDALEIVRQLFVCGCVHSAFWHRFALTVHSPISRKPEAYGIRIVGPPPGAFARNELFFEDATGCDHNRLGHGLRKALYNFMHGIGLDEDVRVWFEESVPKPRVSATKIEQCLGLKKLRPAKKKDL
jgi:hypothetical protein